MIIPFVWCVLGVIGLIIVAQCEKVEHKRRNIHYKRSDFLDYLIFCLMGPIVLFYSVWCIYVLFKQRNKYK